MVSRLVLGCGSIGHAIVDRVADRRGQLLVLSAEESRVETLRNENIAAERADPTDPEAVAGVTRPVDVVVVAGDDPDENVAAAEAAREAYPSALMVAYAGIEPTPSIRERLEAVADRVVDPGAVTTEYLLDRVGDEGLRLRRLRRVLRSIEGTLAVVTHDNPDPDAIASAVALGRIAEAFGVDSEVCYFGSVTHQENRAFINLLDLDLRNIDEADDLSEYGGFALVDHSRPGVNDQLPQETVVDIVVDHHPPRAPVEARFVDLRSDVGATSTLLAGYLRDLDLDLDQGIATGLLYGIRVDTKDFRREVSVMDFEAAAFLIPHVDASVLERVESPSISAETLETVARAIKNRELSEGVLTSCVGRASDRDALAQAADRLLMMEGVTTTLVYGYNDGTVYLSGRARGTDLDLGETLRDAFDRIGSAGGHADMAGAQIPLGLLEEVEDETESLTEIIHDVVTDRFFETLRSKPPGGPAVAPLDVSVDELAGIEGVEAGADGETTAGSSTRDEADGGDDDVDEDADTRSGADDTDTEHASDADA